MQRLDVAETTEAQAWGSVEQVREADVGQAGRRNPYNKGDCVCIFSIGGHTIGPAVLKFCMEDHIYPGEVIVPVRSGTPTPAS